MIAGEFGGQLSIVIVSFNSAAMLERCLESLAAQAAAHAAEILVVRALRFNDSACDRVRARFKACRWLVSPAGEIVPRMRCQGMAAARGAVVGLLEDDCIIDHRWCAAVLQAHRDPWVAVGGAVEPGPYSRARDWAVYLYEYSRFMLPFAARESPDLPGNNVSYKQEALTTELVGRAGADGFYDVEIHTAWWLNGLRMVRVPDLIVTQCHSWPVPGVWLSAFQHGRGFAARRVPRRFWLHRLALALGTLLLPALQTYRISRANLKSPRLRGHLAAALPWVVVFSSSWALGEFVGYLFGPGKSAAHWR